MRRGRENRNPLLLRYYRNYLETQGSAEFARQVAHHYETATLARLATHGSVQHRRASILALTQLAGYEYHELFGRALHDADRGVRWLAEDGIREIWSRAGNGPQRHCLTQIKRLNDGGHIDRATKAAAELCRAAPHFAEAWNQLGIAQFASGDWSTSVRSCWEALAINPFQFEAAVSMGYAYLELDETVAALDCFRQALRIHPDLESIRVQVGHLERA